MLDVALDPQQVTATGELDVATAPPLLRELRAACASAEPVRLDLAAVPFVDLTTAEAIWDLLDERRRSGRAFELTGLTLPVLRTLRFVAVLRLPRA